MRVSLTVKGYVRLSVCVKVAWLDVMSCPVQYLNAYTAYSWEDVMTYIYFYIFIYLSLLQNRLCCPAGSHHPSLLLLTSEGLTTLNWRFHPPHDEARGAPTWHRHHITPEMAAPDKTFSQGVTASVTQCQSLNRVSGRSWWVRWNYHQWLIVTCDHCRNVSISPYDSELGGG